MIFSNKGCVLCQIIILVIHYIIIHLSGYNSSTLKMAETKLEDFLKDLNDAEKTKLLGLLSGAKPKDGNNVEPSTSGAGQNGAGSRDSGRRLDESKIPRLPKFSGVSASKSEPSYRLWKFEVENLLSNYTGTEVIQAIHNSVTVSAADTLMRLGKQASLQDILSKFDNIFGTVVSKEKLLADFYTANQNQNESVAEWSCRLEDIVSHPKLEVTEVQKADMLKSRFFYGLNSDLVRNAIRHCFTTSDYNQLVVLAREAEYEMSCKSNKAVSKPQIIDPVQKALEEISKSLKELKTKSDGWENRLKVVEGQFGSGNQPKQNQSFSGFSGKFQPQQIVCFYCKEVGHFKRDCPKRLNAKGSASQGNK